MAETAKRRFPWVLTIASALVFAVLVTLGVWQVQRLQWKEGLIEQADQAGSGPPEAPSRILGADNPEFARVALIWGEDEVAAATVTLRPLRGGEGASAQHSVPSGELDAALHRVLAE